MKRRPHDSATFLATTRHGMCTHAPFFVSIHSDPPQWKTTWPKTNCKRAEMISSKMHQQKRRKEEVLRKKKRSNKCPTTTSGTCSVDNGSKVKTASVVKMR